MTEAKRPVVRLLGTGGTISSIGRGPMDFTEYSSTEERISVVDHLARLPEIDDFPAVEAEQILEVGSNRIGPAEWLMIADRINGIYRDDQNIAGVAITHGTSTLEETAYFLNLTVKSDRPVVITGAMRPPSALSSDADINLVDCIRVAASPRSRGMGVLTVLNNEIQAARDVTKQNTFRVDTFGGGPLGLLGYADSDHRVVMLRSPLRKHTFQTEFDVGGLDKLPRVDIVYSYAGGDGEMVRAAVKAGAEGIVSAGSGAGGGGPEYGEALEEASKSGIAVVHASHVGSGRVVLTARRREQGFLVSDDLSPKKSRILLMLALTKTGDTERIQEMFYSY